jgi:hypothetical protein
MYKIWKFFNICTICCLLIVTFIVAGYGNNPGTIRRTKENEGTSRTDSILPSIGLIPRGHDYMDNYYSGGCDFYQSELFWVSVTVKDKNRKLITGLNLDNFKLTEGIVTPDGEAVTKPHNITIALKKEHDWELPWFWERTVSDEKMDIVFLVESRGTMSDDMPGIRAQIHKFVDRLNTNHIDFRIAGVGFGETPEWDYFDFHGPGELDKLMQDIDHLFTTGGIWWNPTTSYDALLWTPWLGFRQEARKICVIIADITSQTVYDAYWYSLSCTAMTRSAVELFLKAHSDMKLYYCLNPDMKGETYFDPDINPMAGETLNEEGLGSGFAALEKNGCAAKLSWPFDQRDLPLPSPTISDSQYYFIWKHSFTWKEWDTYGNDPEKYRVQMTMNVMLPDSGEKYTSTFIYPIKKPETTLTINVTDEHGNDFHDSIHSSMYYAIGDRMVRYNTQLYSEDGPIVVEKAAVGSYHLVTRERGNSEYEYETLRAIDRRIIDVPAGGLSLDIQVATADREMELLKARGLLKDLKDNWRHPGDPFREFVASAEAWLDEIEREGIDWITMVRLKRFYVALSGYANLTEYAQQEIKGAIDNANEIIKAMSDIIKHVTRTSKELDERWKDTVKYILLEVAYDILSAGNFTVYDEFIAVLNGIRIVPTAIEFGLRVDSLDTFGNIAEKLSLAAFNTHK